MSAIIVTLTDGWAYRYLFCTQVFDYFKNNNFKIIIYCSDFYFEKIISIASSSVEIYKLKNESSNYLGTIISLRNYLYRIQFDFKISKFYVSKLIPYQRIAFNLFGGLIRLISPYLLKLSDIFLGYAIRDDFFFQKHNQVDFILFLSPYSYEEVIFLKKLKKYQVKKIFILPSWDNIYKYYLDDQFDRYVVWGPDQESFLSRMGIATDKIVPLGSISQYTFNQLKENSQQRKESDRFRILYATVTDRIFPDEYYFLSQLAAKVENGDYGMNVELLIRMHPADNIERYRHLESDKVYFSENKTTYSLTQWDVEKDFFNKQVSDILFSNLVITVASTITLDAVLLNKYTINYRPDFCKGDKDYYQFEHYASITNSGGLPIVSSMQELSNLIQKVINNTLEFDEKMKKSVSGATITHNEVSIEKYFSGIFA